MAASLGDRVSVLVEVLEGDIHSALRVGRGADVGDVQAGVMVHVEHRGRLVAEEHRDLVGQVCPSDPQEPPTARRSDFRGDPGKGGSCHG